MERIGKLQKKSNNGKLSDFTACKTCSNILTPECFDECLFVGGFPHYRQRPGTDIKDLPPFPADEMLNYYDGRERLVTLVVYMTAVVDFLQHMDEYQKIRELYKKSEKEDYSI